MKVLHVIPSIAAVRGGPSIAVIEMVRSLRDIGVDAAIATTNDNGNNLLDVQLNTLHEYEKAPVIFFARFSPSISPIREFAFSACLTTWLWKHLRDYDLIHVHAIFSYPSTIAMAIARLQNIPYLISPHGLLCNWSMQQGKFKKQLYLNLIERSNLECSKIIHLTAAQEQIELELLSWNLASVIVPLGLELLPPIANARAQLHQMLNISLEVPIILFLSRLHPKKGLDYLISALGKLCELDVYNFAFVIAGNGTAEYEAELEQLLQKFNLGDRTYKLGFITGKKKDICLQGADLYVLTSHSENFGIAVLEALASGTPALVTIGVALADLVKKQNLGWVVSLDSEAIAQSIQDFLEHQDIAKEIGDRASQYVAANYTWTKTAHRLSEIYDNILSS